MKLVSNYSQEDLDQIDAIYRKHHANDFYIPNLHFTVTHACVKDNDKVVGFGMVKLFPEAILILDKGASQRSKVECWRMLLKKAIFDSREAGHQYLHATIHDEAYSNLLSKHYGFKDCTGKQVALEL